MAFTPFPALRLLGFQAQGDVAGFTLYTDHRQQLVAFLKSPPKEPPSWAQQFRRNLWQQAATMWKALTNAERTAYRTAARRSGAAIAGYNLWVYGFTTGNHAALHTIEHQSSTPLTMPPLPY